MICISLASVVIISYAVGMIMKTNNNMLVYAIENNFTFEKTDTINVSKLVNVPIDKTWEVVSNLNNSAEYWPLTVTKITYQTNDTLERDVTIPAPPFMDNRAHQILSLDPDHLKVIEKQTQGVVTGIKTISLLPVNNEPSKTQINILWDLDLSKVPGLGKGFAKAGISNSANEALEKMSKSLVS